jgi:hypothetical protein
MGEQSVTVERLGQSCARLKCRISEMFEEE